jgi:AcrR family transcriptional regulator
MPRAEREQRILDVAGGVFARDGYHGASMDDIAAAAEISKPMLYQYFGSKEGLYVAYIGQAGQELIDRLGRALDGEALTPARTRSRVEAFLGFVEEHRDGWRVLWGEATASQPVAEETAQLRAQIAAAIERIVAEGTPTLPRAAVGAAANAIVGSGESLANWWLDHPEVSRTQIVEWYTASVAATVRAIAAAGG